MLKKLFNLIHSIEKKIYPSTNIPKGITSYSQCGEDLLVNYIFNAIGIQVISYVDIGAHHPWYLSNTAFFYQKGSRGINIDPNPKLIKLFEVCRSEDININVGIETKEAVLDFYNISDDSLSTFSKDEAEKLVGYGKKIVSVEKIRVTTINKIIEQYFNNVFPDFLTIDTEGLELEILKTIDFTSNYPKVMCVETAEYSPTGRGTKKMELIDFIKSKGYYLYADTNLNSIFVKRKLWYY